MRSWRLLRSGVADGVVRVCSSGCCGVGLEESMMEG
jgi:hypothetical protein